MSDLVFDICFLRCFESTLGRRIHSESIVDVVHLSYELRFGYFHGQIKGYLELGVTTSATFVTLPKIGLLWKLFG